MDNDTQNILLLAEKYKASHKIPRQVCPRCAGGRSNERSLVLTRIPAGIQFSCYRATCGFRGRIVDGTLSKYVPAPDLFIPEYFTHPTELLSTADYTAFEERYELTPEELIENGVVKCPTRNSFVFPIWNLQGYEVGTLERWYGWQNIPVTRKARYYKSHDSTPNYVPRYVNLTDTMVLVEDVLSCMKVSRTLPAMALLGTTVTDAIVHGMWLAGIRRVIVALDPDMREKSIKLVKHLRNRFPFVAVLYLDKDPKDTESGLLRDSLLNVLGERK